MWERGAQNQARLGENWSRTRFTTPLSNVEVFRYCEEIRRQKDQEATPTVEPIRQLVQ